ncbi:GAF domain-containing protein [Massilia sp. H-1]|nr:GAF domain-containing protein [Massilia sp. H-1]
MIEREQCIKVGDCLCGEAVEQKVTVVHDLRKMPVMPELACRKEGYATISVFQIQAQQQHVGFFNLHFRTPKEFDERERSLLETLAQLLGTAIENLRLGAREREMAVSEERNLVAQGLHDSIAQGLNFLNLQVQMLDQSVRDEKIGDIAEIVPMLRAGCPGKLRRRARTAAQFPQPPGRRQSDRRAGNDDRQVPPPGRHCRRTGGRRGRRAIPARTAAATAVHRAGSAVERAQARRGQPGAGAPGRPA